MRFLLSVFLISFLVFFLGCKTTSEENPTILSSPPPVEQPEEELKEEKPQTIIVPTGSLGEISEVRKKILEKSLESQLDDHFDIVPKELFAEAQEKAFEELDYEECTEEKCISMIQEILQVPNAFQLVLMNEGSNTHISLTWNDLDKKRVEEEYCQGCQTQELRKSISSLVGKLLGVKKEIVKKSELVEKPLQIEKQQYGTSIPWIGTKQLGTSSNDHGYGLSVDSSDNIYVTGETQGKIDENPHLGQEDIFLSKFDSKGTKLWIKQLGTSSMDIARAVSLDSKNNIYVMGITKGGLDGNTHFGDEDIFLIKFDSRGTKLWTKQVGTSSKDGGLRMTVDSKDNIYMTGYTNGALDGKTHFGDEDIFLIKYNSNGIKQWTKQLGSKLKDVGHGVTVDSKDNVYLTGWVNGNKKSEIILVKFNSDGNEQWTRQNFDYLGGSVLEIGLGLTVDSSDNLYVTGLTTGSLDGHINAGSNDIFLFKYNSDGIKQWSDQLGSTSNDLGFEVSVDDSNNIYITGYAYGKLDGNSDSGGHDIFLVKYNSKGIKQWTKQLGTSSNDEGWGVTVDSSNYIYLTGITEGGLDGNTNFGNKDVFLVKYNSDGVKQ